MGTQNSAWLSRCLHTQNGRADRLGNLDAIHARGHDAASVTRALPSRVQAHDVEALVVTPPRDAQR